MAKNLLHSRVFLAVSTVVLVLAVYVVWSAWQWSHYESTTQSSLSTKKQSVVAPTQTSDQKPSANLASLQDVSNQLTNVDELCDTNWAISWQRIIPSVEDSVKDCKEVTKKLAKVKTETERIIAFLETEREVLVAVTPLAQATKLTNKKWDTAIKQWKDAQATIANIKPSQDYKPVLELLEKQLQKVNTAWSQLEKADKSKKRDAYESAYDALDQAITGMIDVVDESETRLQSLLAQLQNSVDNL